VGAAGVYANAARRITAATYASPQSGQADMRAQE
jgi:hypothetical protein